MRMEILHSCFGGSSSTSRKQPSATVEDLCHRFSLSQLRKSTDDFDESRLIGEGPYSAAYRASISINGQFKDIALKRLRRSEPYGISLYKKEIIFMCQLSHPNLVSLVGFCDDDHEMIAAYDYAPNGSLYQQLYGMESKRTRLSWKKRLEISIGVARGLHYLHSGTKRTIIHCDITPVNILLGEDWVPQLKFFGLSLKGPKFSAKDVKPREFESFEGTRGYMAPECLRTSKVTYKSDVYSFGVVLLELICEKTPPEIVSQNDEDLQLRDLAKTRNVRRIIYPSLVGEIAAQCLELYMDIAESCLSVDPSERPDMGDVEVQLEHLLQLQEEADTNHASHAFFI